MKVVSRYVREQKRYTKNDLKSKFSYTNSIIDNLSNDRDKIIAFFSFKNASDGQYLMSFRQINILITFAVNKMFFV